jgi:hypothetical protein
MDDMQPETQVTEDRKATPEELAAFAVAQATKKRIAAAKAAAEPPVYNRTTKNKGRGTPKAKRKVAAASQRRNRR